jgi:hypothetical protein
MKYFILCLWLFMSAPDHQCTIMTRQLRSQIKNTGVTVGCTLMNEEYLFDDV